MLSTGIGGDQEPVVGTDAVDGTASAWPPDDRTLPGMVRLGLLQETNGTYDLRVFDAVMNLTKPKGGLGGGALVVAASGNESQRDRSPKWRIAASLPSSADDVISVSGVGRRGERLDVADFSNSMALVSAPGVDIVAAKAGGGLETLSGTSMACPHIASVAALWGEAIRKGGRTPNPTNVRAELIARARCDVFGDEGAETAFCKGTVQVILHSNKQPRLTTLIFSPAYSFISAHPISKVLSVRAPR